jgi:hypothetical protein
VSVEDGVMDLAAAAAELYGVPPDEFVAERRTLQDRARADGDRDLARNIGRLRKPSTAAWAVNLLSRSEGDEVRRLVELGGPLREAQGALEGDELKELGRRRYQVVAAMRRRAADLAGEEGRPLSRAVAAQVEETLRAAVADEDAGRAVLAGLLTSPLSVTGFGHVDVRRAVADVPGAGAAPPSRGRGRPKGPASGTDGGDERRRRRQEALRRVGAELEEAEDAVRDAEQEARDAERKVDDVTTRRRRQQDRIGEVEDELAALQKGLGTSADELRRAQRGRDAAERRLRTATRARDRARARRDRLRGEA